MKRYYLIFGLFIFLIFASALAPETIFKKNTKILNFGDVMFDRGVRNIIENRGRDPFEYIKNNIKTISGFDEFIVNLEGSITEIDRTECQQKEYSFKFRNDTVERLKSIKVTMVSLANNHSYDCLRNGYDDTKQYLNLGGIGYFDARDINKSYVVKEIHGKKFAFIGIDETLGVIPITQFYPLIHKLKKENDFVIVNIHWGTEYEKTETSIQTEIAQKLIDNGADIIFGHHPHVIEPVKIYKGKAIFYSLGNFVFDQDFGETTVGLGVGVTFEDKKIIFELLPFNIKVFAPDFMIGQEKENFCNQFLKSFSHNGCIFKI